MPDTRTPLWKHNDRLRGHKLLPAELLARLPDYGGTDGQPDPLVQAKFFTPDSSWTWYVTEYDPDRRHFFGWAVNDAMPECAELGLISAVELAEATGFFGLPVERDLYFDPRPLSACKARHNRRLIYQWPHSPCAIDAKP